MASPEMGQRPETDSVYDHMTRLKMKLVQQKIQNEKDRIVNRPPSEESSGNDLENQARLQQAMLRRQELLDKIRREQLLNDENKRPRTYSARKRYTPSPLPPPSRRSLPDFAKYQMYNQAPETYRSYRPEMSQVKHVIEHKVATDRNPRYLPPINQQRAPPVIVQQQQPPQIIPMQQPAPQIIQAPAPPHIIAGGYQAPIIHNLGGPPPEKKGMFDKADFGEMMMMQNAQMHQMVMQKLMLGNLGRQECYDNHNHHGSSCHDSCHDCGSGCCSAHGVHGHCGHGAIGCYDHCLPVPRLAGGAVHHHHYSNPPSQPQVQHYTTMPAMDIRPQTITQYETVPAMELRGAPYRGEFYGGGYGLYGDAYSYPYSSYEYYV
ncbi:uncharacterized protein LOC132730492 isoform X1 [Ruditapes philippinarum]|uniref:uncharacterized protein LOC132730492 isoform X1 n=1 Tax=Ruditapes philippinarum TaxID=129788 RepID=UPI00295BF595|nr:uncharacterized protein LOC132730492 isoform X1 [Ruditapes philippinarum]